MIAGALLTGAICCLAIGLVLSPFSLMGLMFGIGIFGFTPFLTAFVYARNGVRAARAGRSQTTVENGIVLSGGFLLALVAPLILSVALHSAVSNAVDEIIHADAQHAHFAAQRLVGLRFFSEAELNKIADAYVTEQDGRKQEQLRTLYREITGDDIKLRLRRRRD
jgi:hypothetical protein